jgi:hypothetical protein
VRGSRAPEFRAEKELTPDELAEFSIVLGTPAGNLAAVAGVELPAEWQPADPATAAQVQQIIDKAKSTQTQ